MNYEMLSSFATDYGKHYVDANNKTFYVATDPSGVYEYYDDMKQAIEIGELYKIDIKDTQFYYVQFPRMIDGKREGTNLIFWTEVSDEDILLISTSDDIEINDFISIIEEILPLNISQKNISAIDKLETLNITQINAQ